MKFPIEAKAASAVFVFLVLAVMASSAWHTLPAFMQPSLGVGLLSYPIAIGSDTDTCISLSLEPAYFSSEKNIAIEAIANDRVIAKGSAFVFDEKTTKELCFNTSALALGDNKVRVLADGKTVFFHVSKQRGETETAYWIAADNVVAKKEPSPIDWIFGIIVFVFAIFIFSAFVFSGQELVEKLLFSMVSVIVLFILNSLALNALNLITPTNIIVLLILELAAVAAIFRRNLKLGFEKFSLRSITALDAAVIIFIIFLSLFFNVFTASHLTDWNNFYERQSETIAENLGIHETDSLSYLGRGFAFVPGYFLINASFSWLTALDGSALFALVLAVSNLFFLLAVFYIIDVLKLPKTQRAIALILLLGSLPVFSAATLTPRHLIAFSLLLASIGILIKYKNWKISGILAALIAVIQIPTLAAFPLLYIFISRKAEWKLIAKSFALSLVLFGFFYLPYLLKFGIPYQIKSGSWGYMINMPADVLVFTYAAVLFFLIAFAFVAAWKFIARHPIRFDAYRRKLAYAIIAGIAINILVTTRWDVFNIFVISVFIASFMEFDAKAWDSASVLFITFMLVIAFVSLLTASSSLTNASLENPLEYINEKTPENSRVLSNPLYGHDITYLASRPVLADLWVEYADEEKLNDEYEFLKTGNREILDKYKIAYVFSHKDTVHTGISASLPEKELLEFDDLDKVYANETFFVHRVR